MSAPAQQVCAALPEYAEIEKSQAHGMAMGPGIAMAPAPGMVMAPAPGMVMAPGPGMVMAPGPGMVMAPGPGMVMAPGPGMVMAPGPGIVMAPGTTISLQRVQSRDFLVWSIFNVIHMNVFCLGFIAVVFSVKARDRRFVGDQDGAKHYGNTAKHLNIAATVITLLLVIIMIVLSLFGAFTVARYG